MSGEDLTSQYVLAIHNQVFRVRVRTEYVDGPINFTVVEATNCDDDSDWTMILDLDYVQRLILTGEWETYS